MGNGDCKIIVLQMKGQQLSDIMFIFDNQDIALPDLADVNGSVSWGLIMSLGQFRLSA